MEKQELNEIFKLHKLWLQDDPEGEKADLRGADLRGADLRGADLSWAALREADLRSADLQGAYLRSVNLQGADLQSADLQSADLINADLQRAELQKADLRRANLRGADLRGANVCDTKLPDFQRVPRRGSFRAWKKIRSWRDGIYKHRVIEVEIPAEAKRTSVLASNKCRAEAVKVITENVNIEHECYHQRSIVVQYKTGEIVEAHAWNGDIRWACRPGIHFFLTCKEAKNFNG